MHPSIVVWLGLCLLTYYFLIVNNSTIEFKKLPLGSSKNDVQSIYNKDGGVYIETVPSANDHYDLIEYLTNDLDNASIFYNQISDICIRVKNSSKWFAVEYIIDYDLIINNQIFDIYPVFNLSPCKRPDLY